MDNQSDYILHHPNDPLPIIFTFLKFNKRDNTVDSYCLCLCVIILFFTHAAAVLKPPTPAPANQPHSSVFYLIHQPITRPKLHLPMFRHNTFSPANRNPALPLLKCLHLKLADTRKHHLPILVHIIRKGFKEQIHSLSCGFLCNPAIFRHPVYKFFLQYRHSLHSSFYMINY